jgi:hypothetical protein
VRYHVAIHRVIDNLINHITRDKWSILCAIMASFSLDDNNEGDIKCIENASCPSRFVYNLPSIMSSDILECMEKSTMNRSLPSTPPPFRQVGCNFGQCKQVMEYDQILDLLPLIDPLMLLMECFKHENNIHLLFII